MSRYSLAYRKRLVNSSQLLWKFLEKKGLPRSVIATGKSKTIDTLLDEFVASLHDSKTFVKGRLQIAKHAVLFCQVCRPRLRRRLKQTWSTLKAWEEQEPGKLRPPLPIPVLMGMLCQSRILSQLADSRGEKHKWLTFSTLIAVGFFGLLRPGELLNLKRRDIELANQVNLCLPCVTISLDKPKNFRQLGFKQFTTVKHLVTCEWISWLCLELKPDDKLWPHSDSLFRKLFKTCLSHMHLTNCHFTPGSLRAGGATYYFNEEEDMGRLRLWGRWSNLQSLEHYIQSTKAQQMLQTLSSKAVKRLEKLLTLGSFLLELPFELRQKLSASQLLGKHSLDTDVQLWQACRKWGRLEAAL